MSLLHAVSSLGMKAIRSTFHVSSVELSSSLSQLNPNVSFLHSVLRQLLRSTQTVMRIVAAHGGIAARLGGVFGRSTCTTHMNTEVMGQDENFHSPRTFDQV